MSGSAQPKAGYRFEHRCQKYLRDNGYFVMRSPASKSPIDLVAIKPGQVLFVQCKTNGRLDPDGWNALMDAAEPAGAQPVMVERTAGLKLAWWLLTARKAPGRTGIRQPREPFVIDGAALVT